jgi:hypothetical protein
MFAIVFLGLAVAVMATVAVFVLMFVTVAMAGPGRPVASQTKSSSEREAGNVPGRPKPLEESSPIFETQRRPNGNASPDRGLQSVGGDSR